MKEIMEKEVLCMKHDERFKLIDSLIFIVSLIGYIAVFILWIVFLSIESAGIAFAILIGGSIYIAVLSNLWKFILSVAYDLKIIRNKALNIDQNLKENLPEDTKTIKEEEKLL